MYLLQKKYNKKTKSAQACKSLCNSGFGGSGNQLLAACNANNAENAGVRCAITEAPGANTHRRDGFPQGRQHDFPFFKQTEIKPNCRNLASQKPHCCMQVQNPIAAHVVKACRLAKEYKVKQRLVEGCKASANVLLECRHIYSYGA